MIIVNNSYRTVEKKVTAAFLWFGHEYSLSHFVGQQILMIQRGLLLSINILRVPLWDMTIYLTIQKET